MVINEKERAIIVQALQCYQNDQNCICRDHVQLLIERLSKHPTGRVQVLVRVSENDRQKILDYARSLNRIAVG